MRLEEFEPACILKACVFGQVVRLGKRIKPRARIGHTQREVVQADNHLVNLIVAVNRAAELVRERLKGFVAARVVVLEKLLNDLAL